MGLDMYLYRRQYASGYEFLRKSNNANEDREVAIFDGVIKAVGITPAAQSPHVTVDVCVAYWRKANAIHKWFCDLDGGRDECQDIPVSVDQLRQLRDLAWHVSVTPALAASTLPTQQGFFFGSYDYDEWYMEDMKNTVDQIDAILAEIPEDATPWTTSFYYRASW